MKFLTYAILIALTACASREEKEKKLTKVAELRKTGSAGIHSATNKNLKGKVSFEEKDNTLIVTTDIQGLKANSRHGFHVHQNGVCEGPDYKTAGDHYNPTKSKHGSHDSAVKHSGDMGNLMADNKGNSKETIILTGVKLDEVMGKAVLVHEKRDDLKTQPSGDSGSRIGCGLIRPVE